MLYMNVMYIIICSCNDRYRFARVKAYVDKHYETSISTLISRYHRVNENGVDPLGTRVDYIYIAL